MMQSSTLIPATPQIAIIVASFDPNITELATRIADGLRRQNVPTNEPVAWPPSASTPPANCILLLGEVDPIPAARLFGYKSNLIAIFPHSTGLDRATLLKSGGPIAAAIVAKPDMSEKEAALFFVELFSELHNHCRDGINADMLRFCLAKASRLAPNKAERWM